MYLDQDILDFPPEFRVIAILSLEPILMLTVQSGTVQTQIIEVSSSKTS